MINEYFEPCEAIVEGRLREVPALEECEEFSLDGVTYEAFNTSGGLGTLCQTLDGKVRTSQSDRRLVGHALATGRVTRWDHPAGSRRYIGTGDDFWTTLERDRRE